MPIKKIKSEPKDSNEIKKEKEMDKKLEKQDKLYHKYRGILKEFTKADLFKLMEDNSQEIVASFDEVQVIEYLMYCKLFHN